MSSSKSYLLVSDPGALASGDVERGGTNRRYGNNSGDYDDEDDVDRYRYRQTQTMRRTGVLARLGQTCRSQGVFSCSLMFSAFIVMSLVAVTYIQTGTRNLKSDFGCDLGMSPPHASNRTVSTAYCEIHRPLSQVNRDLFDRLVTVNMDTSVRFFVVGDWGRDGFCCQRDVAWEMARAAGTIKPDFIANAGDGFYEYGLESEFEEQVHTSWRNVYFVHESLKGVPWYNILGNHEYRGSVPAVLRLNAHHPEFVMPDRFYEQEFFSNDRSVHVQMLFLDTNPMIAAYRRSQYDDRADTMLNQPDGIRTQWSRVKEQIRWVDERLGNSTANVKIVMGHHPVFTSGSHFHEDDGFLRNTLAPILEKHGVAVYFSGHDHNLQEYWKLYSPTHYIVSAGGSKVEGRFTQADSHLRYFDQVNGFCVVEATTAGVQIAFVDYVGNVIRTVEIPRQQPHNARNSNGGGGEEAPIIQGGIGGQIPVPTPNGRLHG